MDAQDLREVLEKSDDKLSILTNIEIINKYDLYATDLFSLINDFLSDEEKLALFNFPLFQGFDNWIKIEIIKLITDENIALKIITNDNIIGNFSCYEIFDIVKDASDNIKQQLLHNQDFIEKSHFTYFEVQKLISTMNDESQAEILCDKDLVGKLGLMNYQISSLTQKLSTDEAKLKILTTYDFESSIIIEIVNNCTNKCKLNILSQEKFFTKNEKMQILKTLDNKTIIELFSIYKETFFHENTIHPYEVVQELYPEEQLYISSHLKNTDLTQNEKKEILAILPLNVKKNIDTTNFPEEYKKALSIQALDYSDIIMLDLKRDLEDYRGLDNLIKINPEEFTEEERIEFMKLCNICPNAQVVNTLDADDEFVSSASEYKKAEEWIKSIIDNLNSEYSQVQKIAVIDNAIGKKISYSPDHDTEITNEEDCRALWKIISSGYGVCNGIAKVEQYILARIGIDSEIIGTGTHSFLKIKDVELTLANGKTVKGNTILDPTWNLTAHKFGGQPDNFCISYEQARKNDIDKENKDHLCHKNDFALQDATIGLDEQSLRALFTSVGLTDKNGQFPINDLLKKSKLLHEFYKNQPDENINKQFLLLSKTCPEFAICQNSSMRILSDVLLDNENLKFNKCAVNRVYDRNDEKKDPILFVYIDLENLGEKFYFADKTSRQFIELSKEEFIKQFECYEKDLKKNKRS